MVRSSLAQVSKKAVSLRHHDIAITPGRHNVGNSDVIESLEPTHNSGKNSCKKKNRKKERRCSYKRGKTRLRSNSTRLRTKHHSFATKLLTNDREMYHMGKIFCLSNI